MQQSVLTPYPFEATLYPPLRTEDMPYRSRELEASLSRARLRELLDYDPETGEFTWLKSTSNRVTKGSRAGSFKNHNGVRYVLLGIDGRLFHAHRVAWYYMRNEWPDEIDHEDGNGWNNRWRNLREATHRQNAFNTKLRSDNKTGVKGISVAKDGRYNVWLNGKYIGRYPTLDEAKAARELAAQVAHGGFYREQ